MWCGTRPTNAEDKLKRPADLEAAVRLAEARHRAKIRRIGSLGDPVNSARVLPVLKVTSTLAHKGAPSRYGDQPNPKRIDRDTSWAWQAHTAKSTGGNKVSPIIKQAVGSGSMGSTDYSFYPISKDRANPQGF